MKIQDIVASCEVIRLGFIDSGEVYIVPLNFGYSFEEDGYIFYFHSAKAGRKVELVKSSPMVGFEMDANYQLAPADIACNCSSRWQSIIGTGLVKQIEDNREKVFALERIMKHNTGRDGSVFDDKMLEKVFVFKLEVKELSCKEHE